MTREIVMLCCDEGTIVVYNTTLTNEELTKWANKTGNHPHDIIDEKQDNLQYYCIDGRVWMSGEFDERIRKIILE